jgi:hypothetical protein
MIPFQTIITNKYKSSNEMRKQIEEIMNKVESGDLAYQDAVSELLLLYNVSGDVCDNCGEGKPMICAKCYETESNFRESY